MQVKMNKEKPDLIFSALNKAQTCFHTLTILFLQNFEIFF